MKFATAFTFLEKWVGSTSVLCKHMFGLAAFTLKAIKKGNRP